MRTGKISLFGKEYITCMSTRVLSNLEERTGKPAGEAFAEFFKDANIKDSIWLVNEIVQAGDRYAKLNNINNPLPPTLDDLLDGLGPDDFTAMFNAINETASAGRVQAAAERKNAKTTQEP